MKFRARFAIFLIFFNFMFFLSSQSYSACIKNIRHNVDIKDGVAIDNASGLVWQRCLVGTRWNSHKNRCDGKVKGLTHPEALIAASRAAPPWRLPSARELASLRLNKCHGPKIDTTNFPNISASDLGEGMNIWSSTPAISDDTFYFVNFTDGSFDFHSEGFNLPAILVRKK